MRPKKESHLKCPLEKIEAESLIEWAKFHPIVALHLVHIANEGKRTLSFGRALKKQGWVKGIPDYFLAYPVSPHSGLWLELKRRDKSLSKVTVEQHAWLNRMSGIGYRCEIAYGWEDAKDKILEYIK